MSTFLPKDSDDQVIQAVRLKKNASHTISATGLSTRNSTAFDEKTRIVSVYTTEPVFISFGDSSVTASSSDHYFPDGIYYDFAIGGGKVKQYTHLSVIAADVNGTVYISEKE